MICPFGSVEPALENWIAAPSFPLYGPFALATGGSFGSTVTTTWSVPVPSSLSVTETFTVKVPGDAKECVMAGSAPCVAMIDEDDDVPSPQATVRTQSASLTPASVKL